MSRSNQLAGLITATPTSTLDTINEINTSLNNDNDLSGTLTGLINAKASKSGDTFTGDVTFSSASGQFKAKTTGDHFPGLIFDRQGTSVGAVVYDTAQDALEIYTDDFSGQPQVTVNNAGNVGIGDTNPDEKLVVTDNRASKFASVIKNSHASGAGLKVVGAQATQYSFVVRDYTDNTNSLIVLGNGKVGVGTTSPSTPLHIYKTGLADASTTALLTIDGKFVPSSIDSSDVVGIAFRVENGLGGSQTTTCIGSSFQSSYNALLLQPAGGNVGIGTTSPDAPLDIEASHSYNTDASNHANGLRLTNASTGNMSIEWWHSTGSGTEFASIVGQTDDIGSNSYDDGNLVFRTKHEGTMADRMLIQSNGNIGIATTAPNSNALLHIVGNGAPSNSMGVKGLMLTHSNGNSAPIYFGAETNTSAKAMYMRAYYIHLRGHENEGIKFSFSGSSNPTKYKFLGANSGEGSNQCFNASNSSSWNTSSDSRIKENVQSLPDGAISKINALRPVTFDYTDEWAEKKGWFNYTASSDDPHDITENGFDLKRKNNDVGWIAQEYENVFPEDVDETTETVNGSEVNDFKTLKPDSLLPYVVKSIQELSAKVTALENAS